MSLDIRYLTNGTDALYTVVNSGVSPIQKHAYFSIDDIPPDIRHYAPKGEPTFIGPDASRFLGVQEFLYPDFPKCKDPEYFGHRCIAESCHRAVDGDWTKCPYFKKQHVRFL